MSSDNHCRRQVVTAKVRTHRCQKVHFFTGRKDSSLQSRGHTSGQIGTDICYIHSVDGRKAFTARIVRSDQRIRAGQVEVIAHHMWCLSPHHITAIDNDQHLRPLPLSDEGDNSIAESRELAKTVGIPGEVDASGIFQTGRCDHLVAALDSSGMKDTPGPSHLTPNQTARLAATSTKPSRGARPGAWSPE